jgi:hypothetical protein
MKTLKLPIKVLVFINSTCFGDIKNNKRIKRKGIMINVEIMDKLDNIDI